ncbi:MAG: cytochrome c [Chloroflexi bacterium]|nr:cytochrome c [Chloroflexota bacterium]
MKLAGLMAAAGLVAAGVVGTVQYGTAGAAAAEGDPTHGKYVFQLASCAGCHGQNLAGWREGAALVSPATAPYGEMFAGPFGRVPAANITPDKETGIGSWTDEQIANAVRNGHTPDGGQLMPMMPYPHYHFLSDGDVADLVAFLRTVPPVSNKVPARTLNGPVPPAPPLPPSPASAPTEGVARGDYLVNAVVPCSDCHTPRTESGAPDRSKFLAGGAVPREPGHFAIAPNITPDMQTGIGRWSEDDIAKFLQTGQTPRGGFVEGLMAEVIENHPWGGLNQLTDADAHAIAAYLKTIPAVNNRPTAPSASGQAAPSAQPSPAAKPSGAGAPPSGPAPAAKPSGAQQAPGAAQAPRPAASPAASPAARPAQVPSALPRTGALPDLAAPAAALGGLLMAAGVWLRRRR